MHITPPADDYGLQKLKKTDAKNNVSETARVEPYPRVESTEERHEQKAPMVADRRKHQRRQNKNDRRQASTATSYDTRSSQERRQHIRRKADREQVSSTTPTPPRVDDFA